MNIQLSNHFSYKKLIRFVLPSIGMMIFTSIYGVVDGLFVSNFVGKTAFAAINLVIPFTMILGAVGFMLGTGGNALVAKTLGEFGVTVIAGITNMVLDAVFIGGLRFGVAGAALATGISQCKSMILAAVLILPAFFGIDGIWAAISVAEILALGITAIFFVKLRNVYHYI